MPLNDNIMLYVTISYFPPTCFGLHQDLLITDLNRSFSLVHIIFSTTQLLSRMFRTATYQNRNVFICLHVTVIILVYIFFEIFSKTNIFCLLLCTIHLHIPPTHPPQSLLFQLTEHASLQDPFIYNSLRNSSVKKHTLHENNGVVPDENGKCATLISLSRFRKTFVGSCGIWTVVFTRLHKNLSVKGLQNCFLLENFVNYTEA